MNNLITQKISFCAGYGDPSRTIKKKFMDYNAINDEIQKYTLNNEKINQQISFLKQEIAFMVATYPNLDSEGRESIEQKIDTLKDKIVDLENEIENNRAESSALWYSYHERL